MTSAAGISTRVMFALVFFSATLLSGCDKNAPRASAESRNDRPTTTQPPASLRDYVVEPLIDDGERDIAPLRIVSAAPNVTEICCALGLRNQLVGRTRYCVYPPDITEVASIGALNDMNVEALLTLKPDIILVSGQSRAQRDRFDALKIRFEAVPDTTLCDLFRAIRQIGELAGRARTAGRLCESIERDLAAVDQRYAKTPAARVLLLTGTLTDPPRPPYVAGPGSFYDDLITRAGHQNVVNGTDAAFAPLSLEFIIQANPDAIIELDPDGSSRPGGDADARRVWAKVGALRAVASRRVRVLTGPEHYLLGPRIALTYGALCSAITEPSDD